MIAEDGAGKTFAGCPSVARGEDWSTDWSRSGSGAGIAANAIR